jgi:HTH-type transcriptional regulator/antitoxin HipB
MKSQVIRTSGQLGPFLKQMRRDRRLSQTELGKKIGLSQERISAIENHPESVTFNQLLTVLMALDGELMVCPRTTSRNRSGDVKPEEAW